MTSSNSDDRLIELLMKWAEAQEDGRNLSPEEICCTETELLPRLLEEIKALSALDRMISRDETVEASHEAPVQEFLEISGYELIDVIGSGGMGVVYRAYQPNLDRFVAIKTVRFDASPSGSHLERFELEAQALAQITHPNVVQVFDAIVERQRIFLVLEYVPGGNLGERFRKEEPTPREAAEAAFALASALAAIHEKNILHRDLKPSNVLCDRNGILKITDFGLAKILDSDSNNTVSGAILGTPSYMAPEQARGDIAKISFATDVYGIGATLYELLTRRPPFVGSTQVETLQYVQNAEPLRPSVLIPGLARELETICLKCLEKEPTNRYASCDDLAQDLQRFLDGVPISARPISKFNRGWRWCRRNPEKAGLAATLFAAILTIAATVSWFGARLASAEIEQKLSNERLNLEMENRKLQELFTLVGRIQNRSLRATQGWVWHNLEDIRIASNLAPNEEAKQTLRTQLATCFQAFDVRPLKILDSNFDCYCLAYHPNGQFVAVGGNRAVAGLFQIRILRIENGIVERTLQSFMDKSAVLQFETDGVRSLTFSHDGSLLLAGTRSGRVEVWEWKSGKKLESWKAHDDWVNDILVDEMQHEIWTCSRSGSLKRWRRGGSELLSEYQSKSSITQMTMVGKSLFANTSPPCWLDRLTLKHQRDWPASATDCRAVARHPDKRSFLVASGRKLNLYTEDVGDITREITPRRDRDAHQTRIAGIEIDPRGRWILSWDSESINLWDLATLSRIQEITTNASIRDAAFHPTKPEFICVTDKHVEHFEVFFGPVWENRQIQSTPLRDAVMSRDGKVLVSAAVTIERTTNRELDSWLSLESIDFPQRTQSAKRLRQRISSIAISDEGDRVAAAYSTAGRLELSDWKSFQSPQFFPQPDIKSPKFSATGDVLWFVSRVPGILSNSDAGALMTRNLPDGDPRVVMSNSVSKLTSGQSDIFDYSVGRDTIVVASHDGNVRILDRESYSPIHTLGNRPDLVETVWHSTTDSTIVLGDRAGRLTLVDFERGSEHAIDAHEDQITSLAGTETGLVVTGSRDRTVKIWRRRPDNLELLIALPTFSSRIVNLSLSADENRLLILCEGELAARLLHLDRLKSELQHRNLGW